MSSIPATHDQYQAHYDAALAVLAQAGDEAHPHPALDGSLIKSPDNDAVYLIWNGGYRSLIPNMTTFGQIFNPQAQARIMIITQNDINKISEAEAINDSALVCKTPESDLCFFVNNGVKHPITSPAAITRYQFVWPVPPYPRGLIDPLQVGDAISE